MEAVLLIDFGSTYTKVTAVDTGSRALLGTASSYTTVETDVGEGLATALKLLTEQTGELRFVRRMACSSAAGGLRMVACGLTKELTAKAARVACLGAGAKVIRTFSHELTDEDLAELEQLRPDILLLAGGTDGGNQRCILQNAEMLKDCKVDFPILLAGNRSCTAKCEGLLAGREVHRCSNVMPGVGELNIGPVQEKIREIFLERIVRAKGLSEAAELISGILMPTPAAVLRGLELLSQGAADEPGLGELVAVDLGGATTDIYSIALGLPRTGDTVLRGLPEPRSKRTVEGDIGMRYSAKGVLEAAGSVRLAALSDLNEDRVTELVEALAAHPDALAEGPEAQAVDDALAKAAIEIAMERHAGRLEEVFTPTGPVYAQTGKDLRDVGALVVTGGALIHSPKAAEIAAHAFYRQEEPYSLKPVKAKILVDRQYILASMGLLAESDSACAFAVLKAHLAAE